MTSVSERYINNPILVMIAAITLLCGLVLLGGLPPEDQIPVFILGIGLTAVVHVIFGLAVWHLLFREMPASHKIVRKSVLTGYKRHVTGLLLLVGVINVAIATIWDEIWHATYGIPFGEDFFWRPHLLMYFGFAVTIVTAMYGLYVNLFKNKGTLQQRFRTDPIYALVVFAGIYLLYALPADPVWHLIYGEDLSAFSLPHVVLILMVLFTGLSSVILARSNEASDWGLLRFRLEHLWHILAYASVSIPYMVIFGVDWYALQEGMPVPELTAARPDWMLPALVVLMSVFIGVSVLRTTRQIGVATLTGILVLLVRTGMESVLNGTLDGTPMIWASLPILLSLDIAYGVRVLRNQPAPSILVTAIFATIGLGVGALPLIDSLFAYPPITASTIPLMLVAGFVMALISTWFSTIMSDSLMGIELPADSVSMVVNSRSLLTDVAIYAAFGVFTVVFMVTASPPVA